jgi:hypothetical protein
LAASREGSSSTTVTVKMESTAFCSLAEEIGSTVAGAVEQRQKNGIDFFIN